MSDASREPASTAPAPATPVHSPVNDVEPRAPEAAVLTIEELADFLRVNHKTVRDAIARGEIPGVRRIGGTIRIYRVAVLHWFAAGQGRAPDARRRR